MESTIHSSLKSIYRYKYLLLTQYSFFSDSTCFNWFIDCNQDSITLREDASCMGKTYVFADEDTYYIEKYSPTEIKLLKYFEQMDSSGTLLKHFERYFLFK